MTLEIHLSGWDPNHDGDPVLRGYQAQIDSTGFSSGDSGVLALPMIPVACETDQDCKSVWGGCEATGFCVGSAAFTVDESHTDFLFLGLESIVGVDCSQPDMRLGSIVMFPVDSVADVGLTRYLGTLILELPYDAWGTFTIGFKNDENQTFLMDGESMSFPPSSTIPALITVTNDCNGNSVPDEQDIASGTSEDCNDNGTPDECESDCNGNGIPDDCDIADGTSEDCNADNVPDECQLADCNGNGVLDVCDIAGGTSEDCNTNLVPDECEPDCNHNGQADECDIDDGLADDGNGNGVPDECEIARISLVPTDSTVAHVIDGNGITIIADPAAVTVDITLEIRVSHWDFDLDGYPLLRSYQASPDPAGYISGESGELFLPTIEIPCTLSDHCPGYYPTCEGGVCDVNGAAMIDTRRPDFVFAGIEAIVAVDARWPDLRFGGITLYTADCVADPGTSMYAGTLVLEATPDARGTFTIGLLPSIDSLLTDEESRLIEPQHLVPALITIAEDCNGNGVPDNVDIANGTSSDCNGNGTPDDCEPDCNHNGQADECDIADETSEDCNGDGVPDECGFVDCNGNGVLDECDITDGFSDDCDENNVPDECEFIDCNSNGILDRCDIAYGVSIDCDANDVPDECEFVDCNDNGIGDNCDLVYGTSDDVNANGIPDDCEPPSISLVPVASNGLHFTNGNEIVILAGGEVLTLEIYVANWDLDRDGHPLLRNYQATIDSSGYTSGASGALAPAAVRCMTDEDCFGESTCGTQFPGYCSVSLAVHPAAYIDESHPEFLFAGGGAMVAVDVSEPDYRFAGMPIAPSGSMADIGLPRYAGTLILDVTSNATGTFTIGFLPPPVSFMTDESMPPVLIEPLSLVPAVITVLDDCNDNGISDVDDIYYGVSQDCNDNGFPDECDIGYGESGDCDANGVPDECDPDDDCNENGVQDICDIAAGTSQDMDGSGAPDECEYPAPAVQSEGCRYLKIEPSEHPDSFALLLTSADYPCLAEYVTLDVGRGRLVGAPVFMRSVDWGTVLLGDAFIIPGTRYEVRADFGGGLLSAAAPATTAIWGDTIGAFVDGAWEPPDGNAGIIDIMAILDGFKHLPTAPPVEWTDLYPDVPDGSIDIIDAAMGVDAFKSFAYPYDPPCP